MNLSWSQDQQLLIETSQRFATRYYTAKVRANARASADGASPQVWQDLAAQGWLGVAVPESNGGFGGGALEIGILAEGAGHCLLIEPWLWTAVEAVRLIREAASTERQAPLLAQIAQGGLRVAVAHLEDAQSGDEWALGSLAKPAGTGWRLSGQKRFVMDAGVDLLLCSATDPTRGLPMLFAIDAKAPGVRLSPMRSLDERGLCHVQLDDVAVARGDCLAEGQGVRHAVQRSRDALRLALCSEAVGAMEVLLQQTVAYSQTRKQFGRPLSANQVLRHRMVDMAIAVRETRALALRAAILADDATQPELQRRRAVLGATAKATAATRLIAEEAIQLHGAMGVTEELSVGLYVKRLMFCQMVWGPQSQQLRARAEMDEALASGAPEHAPREPEHA